ncbi:MAG: sulfite oxidase [Planctomycetia bacterium]|nr:sulfite oxidase [Planctomycetia bacterium]
MNEERRIVTAVPENSETPLEQASSWVTPNRLFFVRNHFDEPRIDAATWRLSVEGLVERPLALSLSDLAELPERTVFATMECAGNGRSFLTPHVHGVQWGAGAIGHAEWTGVPLKALLERAGMRPGTVDVLFEGCDRGSEADHPEPMNFARTLPLAKALERDTLLATHMNGQPLEPIHGFPLRLLVPGWYGVASVKWLSRIEVLDQAFDGYFQTKKYTIQQQTPAGAETVVVGPMPVKSEIIRPQEGETLGLGTSRVFGVAWAGQEPVGRVEVSTDGGRSWTEAELIGPRTPYCWTLWEYLWEVGAPGRFSILARAASASGRVQPMEHDELLGGYMIHFSRPRNVAVEPARRSRDERADAETLVFDMNAFAEENVRRPLDVELEFAGGGGI